MSYPGHTVRFAARPSLRATFGSVAISLLNRLPRRLRLLAVTRRHAACVHYLSPIVNSIAKPVKRMISVLLVALVVMPLHVTAQDENASEPGKIHQDVYPVTLDHLCHVVVAEPADILVLVELGPEMLGDLVGAGDIAVSADLNCLPVVRIQQRLEEIRDGMPTEIG